MGRGCVLRDPVAMHQKDRGSLVKIDQDLPALPRPLFRHRGRMEMEAIRSLVTSVPREGVASAAPGGLEWTSLAKSGVPIDQLPLFPSPSWQKQEAAELVRSFLPPGCQGTRAPRPAWIYVYSEQDGSSFGGLFVPLLLFSLLHPPPQDVTTISC